VNRASELWFGLKPLIRSGQIAGLDDPDTLLELCARTYTNRGGRVEIESKDKMKLRTKKSPDKGDSFCIMVDVARLRHGLTATERPPPKPKTSEVAKDIFGQTFDLEALKPKKSGHKIMSPLLQEESLYMGMGGWEN
jgi:hypothetical protein